MARWIFFILSAFDKHDKTQLLTMFQKDSVHGVQSHLKFSKISFSRFSKLPSSLRDSSNFVKTLKLRVKLILNCPRAHAIAYASHKDYCQKNDVRACQAPLPLSSSTGMSTVHVHTIGLRTSMRVELTQRWRFTANCMLGPNGRSHATLGCYHAVCKTDVCLNIKRKWVRIKTALLMPRVRRTIHFFQYVWGNLLHDCKRLIYQSTDDGEPFSLAGRGSCSWQIHHLWGTLQKDSRGGG